MKLRASHSVILLAAMTLTGCTVGPNYIRPEVPVAAAYRHEGGWRSLGAAEAPPPGDWWILYDDPQLDRLMQETAASNLSVAQADARYRQALAQLGLTRADGLPLVQGTSSVQRSGRENHGSNS